MSDQTDVLVKKYTENGITTLTMNKPERRNSLSMAMLEALSAELEAVSGDAETRVVVLAAAGQVFCAGHDLKEMTAGRAGPDGGRAYFARIMSLCSGVMQLLTLACR